MPTKAELNVLFRNRAAIGGFDTTGSNPAGWYWSSSRFYNGAWAQRFSDGIQYDYPGTTPHRCAVSGDEPFDHLIISGFAALTKRRKAIS